VRKLIILLAMSVLSSYGQILPDYGSENLVAESDKPLYFAAITLDLNIQNLNTCKNGLKWNLVDWFLAGKNEKGEERSTELYKLDSEAPLFVLRAIFEHHKGVDAVDFKIHTNPEMTQIMKVEYIDYKIVSERRNIGTLADPTFIDQDVVKIVRQDDCY
jgi:hypothetical protein